ncbi:hypothetical protein [Boudabousia marimammalium]|uniref:Uncharacterized protein n=1 Tax=Boudabousia marimammalium TaxID=156892 RepID=A0A1Q5PRH2_9ACTO|nr:hypothetical protein [Boudabousia marimammalium]OKL50167.1 hypothetical protein BM477_01870 [Boudabousia marimammalium]
MGKFSENQAQKRVALALSVVVLAEGVIAVGLAWWLAGSAGIWGTLLGCFGLALLTAATIFELKALANHSTHMLPIALFSFLFKMVMVLVVGVLARHLPICNICAMIVIAVGILSTLIAEAVALIKYYPNSLNMER